MAVVIDKETHRQHFADLVHPYHFCLECLVERYIQLLEINQSRGEVITEARGKDSDRLLRNEYRVFHERGSVALREMKGRCLTSKDIQIFPKSKRIEGLELADLLAYNAKRDVLIEYGRDVREIQGLSREIHRAMASKYFRPAETVRGFGKLLLE